MNIYLAADHQGLILKNRLSWLVKEGYQVKDMGNHHFDPDDDYPDFARNCSRNESAV